MILEQLIEKVAKVLPDGHWSEDDDGQIIFHSNLKCDSDDNIVPFGRRTDIAYAESCITCSHCGHQRSRYE